MDTKEKLGPRIKEELKCNNSKVWQCDIVIYKKYIFSFCLQFWVRIPKVLGISYMIRAFCYVKEASEEEGWLPGEPTMWPEGSVLLVPPPWSLREGEGLEVETNREGQWFNLCLCNEASIQNQRMGFGEHVLMLGEWRTQRGRRSSTPLPVYHALCSSSIWLFPNYSLL